MLLSDKRLGCWSALLAPPAREHLWTEAVEHEASFFVQVAGVVDIRTLEGSTLLGGLPVISKLKIPIFQQGCSSRM